MKQVAFTLLLLLAFSFSSTKATSTVDVFWIDRYGNISWEDEKARLDNFAIQLLNQPDQVGYIIVNVGLVSCKGEAQRRAARAKCYLVHVRDVPENRIIWRDIGYRDSFEVSLWLVPRLRSSLCNLGVLCVSVVSFYSEFINHRDTEDTEVAQRNPEPGLLCKPVLTYKFLLIRLVSVSSSGFTVSRGGFLER